MANLLCPEHEHEEILLHIFIDSGGRNEKIKGFYYCRSCREIKDKYLKTVAKVPKEVALPLGKIVKAPPEDMFIREKVRGKGYQIKEL